MKSEKAREVILDLGAERTEGILQRKVMDRLLELLRSGDLPDATRSCDPQATRYRDRCRTPESLRVDSYHKHRAILLAGRRGEGKTTFLTDLLRKVEEAGCRDGGTGEAIPRLLSLGLIDPTMLESKQNIILSVISRINDVVDHHHRRGDCSGTAGDRAGATGYCSYRDVKEAFELLAQGVTVLDGVGNDLHQGENWADARFIMDHGLTRTQAAYGFRQRLESFIAKAASYLCCPGFLLCIDDVDTRFDIGQKVLEALRKYLTSPHLHVIVSGDPELLLTLVRRLQWQEMGREYLKFEQDVHPRDARESQLDSALDQMGSLTDQYLTKVLPIDRRLRLATLDELVRAGVVVKVRFANKLEPEVSELIEGIVGILWGARALEDQAQLCSVLMQLPIRSILEILRASPAAQGRAGNTRPGHLLDALLQISQTDLRNADAPPLEALRSSAAAQTFALIAGWFSKRHMWRIYGELPIRFANDRENRVALSVSALIVHRCRGDLGAILSFWLSFALLQDRVERQEAELENPDWDRSASDVLHLYEFLGMGSLERPTVQMGRLAAWDRGQERNRLVSGGLRLSGFAVPAIRIRYHNEAFRALYGRKWVYNLVVPSTVKPTSRKTTTEPKTPVNLSQELSFFAPGGRIAELDDLIRTFPEEIRPYHERLKGAQVGGYRYGDKRQALRRAVCNTIEDLSDGLEGAAGAVVSLPYSIVLSGQGYAFGNYGFRRLLAVLIDVLNAARNAASPEKAKKAVQEVIAQAMIRRGHPTPFAQDLGIATPDIDPEDGLDTVEDIDGEAAQADSDKDIAPLADALTLWAIEAHNRLAGKTIAPKVFLAIWKRFNFAQGRLFEHPSSGGENRRYLGYMMHRCVVMFLHAVAVEGLRSENVPLQSSLQNNPTHSDMLFARLLDKIRSPEVATSDKAGVALFNVLFDCPLWGFFLKDTAGLQPASKDTASVRETYLNGLAETTTAGPDLFKAWFTPAGKDVTPVAFNGLYDLLNSVYLQR